MGQPRFPMNAIDGRFRSTNLTGPRFSQHLPKPGIKPWDQHPRALATVHFEFTGPIRWKLVSGRFRFCPKDSYYQRKYFPIKPDASPQRAQACLGAFGMNLSHQD